jgi:hypothetical protein
MIRRVFLVALSILLAAWTTLALADFTVGQRVRVTMDGAQYDGTVDRLGDGDYSGYYFIQYDSGGHGYVQPANIEALAPAEETAPDPAASATYQVGDRVEVYASGTWFPGVVTALGSGDQAGEYYVHFDSDADDYAQPAQMRLPQAPATQVATAEPGLYVCTGFDGATYRWSLALGTNGVYQQQKPDTEAGYYEEAGDLITFKSGNYADVGWFGRAVNEGGQTIVVLRSLANEQQGPRYNEYENFYCHIGQ